MKRVLAAASVLAFFCGTPAALGQPTADQDLLPDNRPWQRLPDGRVVIEIKVVKFTLPTFGPELDDLRFANTVITLRQALEHPERAREAFRSEKQIFVSVVDLPNRTGQLLGKFDREKYLGMILSFSVGEGIDIACRNWHPVFDDYRIRIKSGGSGTDSNGWTEFKLTSKDPETIYVRAENTPNLPTHFDSFICDWAASCEAITCFGNSYGYSYRFPEKRYPRNTWPEVVQRAADVMNSIWNKEEILRSGN